MTLNPDTMILSTEQITEALLDVPQEPMLLLGFVKPAIKAKPIVNAFTVGLSYIAGDAETSIDPDALANIPVGMQDHAISAGSIRIEGSPSLTESPQQTEPSEAYSIAKNIQKKSAKSIAYDAAKKRVSRRLLLAERAKKITVTCNITGIVSQMDIPVVPGKVLVWTSPLADLANCRGIAQQGYDYLRHLDTQTLAGVLIVLADAYSLFEYQPFDSGAQKNAIIRTAGKDRIIQAIILIEDRIHSGNCKYLPKLALRMDAILSQEGAEVRFHSYLQKLADAIAEPDKEEWDENRALPQYPIRPVYTKDVEKKQKTVSFLAKAEVAAAKKQFALDKKEGKALVLKLSQTSVVTDKLRILLNSLLSDDGLISIPSMVKDKLIERLTDNHFGANEAAAGLVRILRRDRRALQLDLNELEEAFAETAQEEQDDPAPGNEAAVEDTLEEEAHHSLTQEQYDAEPTMGIDGENMGNDLSEPKLVPPEGLSTINKILWKKKMEAAMKKERHFEQSNIPSTVSYVPSAKKQTLGEKE